MFLKNTAEYIPEYVIIELRVYSPKKKACLKISFLKCKYLLNIISKKLIYRCL